MDKHIEKMLRLGVIEESDSEWCSPALIVKKKNDPLGRFCISFVKLNQWTKDYAYPLPNIMQIIYSCRNAKCITS